MREWWQGWLGTIRCCISPHHVEERLRGLACLWWRTWCAVEASPLECASVLQGRRRRMHVHMPWHSQPCSQHPIFAPTSRPKSLLDVEQAADHLERMYFVTRGPAQRHFEAARAAFSWQPPQGLTSYQRDEQEGEHYAAAALRAWAAEQPSWEAVKASPLVPASLLPELARLRGEGAEG